MLSVVDPIAAGAEGTDALRSRPMGPAILGDIR
jgi:hypothetical protein